MFNVVWIVVSRQSHIVQSTSEKRPAVFTTKKIATNYANELKAQGKIVIVVRAEVLG